MQQLKPLTMRRNFSWTFFGNVVYAACQWGMLVVLAKIGSPEMVGQFTLGLAVTAPVLMFTNLQLRTVQVTDAKHQYSFSDYLHLRLISVGVALLIIAVITFTAGYSWQTSLVILMVGLAKAVESVSDIFYGLLQQHERMDRIAVSMIIKGILSLLLLGAGVYFSSNVLGGVVGLVVAWTLVLVGYDIRNGALILNTPKALEDEVFESRKLALAKLVLLALPLGFVMMLLSLNTNIPNYFIKHYLGERELGIYAAIAYLMVAGNIVVSALGESGSPRLAKYYAAGNVIAYRRLLFKFVGVGVLLGGTGILVAVVAGKEILTLFYQPEYAEYADLFVWLMVAAAISYISSFLGQGMTAARYFRVQMPLFALVTSISAIACFWLIPSRGLQGAAMALIVAVIVRVSLSLGVILHALHKLPRYLEKESEL